MTLLTTLIFVKLHQTLKLLLKIINQKLNQNKSKLRFIKLLIINYIDILFNILFLISIFCNIKKSYSHTIFKLRKLF